MSSLRGLLVVVLLLACVWSVRARLSYSRLEPVAAGGARAHLALAHVRRYCARSSQRRVCASHDSRVCAARPRGGEGGLQYRDFENACFLFLKNMCDFPGREFSIVWDSSCETFAARRRAGAGDADNTTIIKTNASDVVVPEANASEAIIPEANVSEAIIPEANVSEAITQEANASEATASDPPSIAAGAEAPDVTTSNATTTDNSMPSDNLTSSDNSSVDKNSPLGIKIARSGNVTTTTTTTVKKLVLGNKVYPEDWAYDGHFCPLDCLSFYDPVCVTVNRGYDIHMKIFYFMNHCYADRYYCIHPDEFERAPGMPSGRSHVVYSPISWTFCAHSRYLSFARFTEQVSSMGHYGWLAGDFKTRHILEPHERVKTYG